MKKIFAILLIVFCGFALIGGGIFLFTGCSFSQEEIDNNDSVSVGEDENLDNDEDDEEIVANADVDYYVYTLYRTSSTNISIKSSAGYFNAYWRDNNNNAVTWGNPTTLDRTACSGKTMTGGGSGDNYIKNIVYLHHVWGMWGGNRMLYLVPYVNTSFSSYTAPCGVSSSTANSSNRTYDYSNYFIYNYSNITTDVNTAKAGCNYHVTGTWYIHFRAIYSISFDANGGTSSSAPDPLQIYAGVGFSLPASTPTRTGYTFVEWNIVPSGAAESYLPGQNLGDDEAFASRTFYAIWRANSYSISYNSNGGSGVSSDMVRYDDYYAKGNLYLPNTTGDLNSISNNICSINYTNNTGGTVFKNFFQPYNNLFSADTSYTVVIEVLSFNKTAFYLRLTSPNEGGTNLDVATESTGCTINGIGTYKFTFKTRSSIGSPQFNLRSYIAIDAGYSAIATFRISIFTGNINYSTFSYGNYNNLPSGNNLPTPTRTGYTFAGWYLDSALTKQVTRNTLVSTASNHTLYAKWTINSYTLTIYYYGGSTRQTNLTSVTVKPSWTIASTSIQTSGSYAKYNMNYSTTALSVRVTPVTTSGRSYYINVGSEPTMNSSLFYTTIPWTPTVSKTVYVYVRQQYTISYDLNNGTGTDIDHQLKMHGTDITLKTNSLSRTSYSANGWNTNAAGTGTHYASGASYSANGNATLYADWTPQNVAISLVIMTSEVEGSYSSSMSGGSASFVYQYDSLNNITTSQSIVVDQQNITKTNALKYTDVRITPVAKDGYVYMGVVFAWNSPLSLNKDIKSVTLDYENSKEFPIYICFKKISDNQLKYDSTEKYWYFEDGVYPQSYVGDSLNNVLSDKNTNKKLDYVLTANVEKPTNTISVRTTGGSWETICTPIVVEKETNYKLQIEYSVPDYTPLAGYNGVALMILNNTPGNYDCISQSLIFKELPKTASEGVAELKFNSKTNTMLYIVLNFGFVEDNHTYQYKFSNISVTNLDENRLIEVDNNMNSWKMYNPGSSMTVSYDDGIMEIPVYMYNNLYYAEVTNLKQDDAEWEATDNSFYTLSQGYKYTDKLTMNVYAYMTNWADYGGGNMRIISCTEGGGWNIESSNGNINFAIYDAGVGYKSVTLNKTWSSLSSGWHMFTLTFDGSYARGYIDGVLQGTSALYSSGKIGYNSANTIFVGAEAGGNSSTPAGLYFKGKIKDISILNLCLNDENIQSLYNSGYYTLWFEVEPIRWRVSDYGVSETEYPTGWETYGTCKTDFTVVSDKILTVGAVTFKKVSEGNAFMSVTNIVPAYASYSFNDHYMTISYDSDTQTFTLENSATTDPYATIKQSVELTSGVKYKMHIELTNESGAKVGKNALQVFYGKNGSYSETNSIKFGGDIEDNIFTAPSSATYRIRFDNDYGDTLIIKNFSITAITTNYEEFELASNVDNNYRILQNDFKYEISTIVDNYIFGYSDSQDKVLTSKTYSDGIRVASIEEIGDYLSDYTAKASDMVAFLLGSCINTDVEYWTRNLGSNLGNGQIISTSGVSRSCWLDRVKGVRFSLTMSEGSRY